MKKINIIICCFLMPLFVAAQQINIPRIDQMPDIPSPYFMRDWKQVAKDYDNLVFDIYKEGKYLPLTTIGKASGVNYPGTDHIRMSTYVGQNSEKVAEGINILPAIVGASLVGIDKTDHLGYNWVVMAKDFFNQANGQNLYLNSYSSITGKDWWYEVMPSVFFYQLYELYPDADPDFDKQFTAIADRQLEVIRKLGGQLNPRKAPYMNYRAFNLLTGEPRTDDVPEPETAGSIAWILYQAYLKTGNTDYKDGALVAMDFLENWNKNPSYEIQLPYGIITAARMNAELGTNYDIEKFMNWAFSDGIGTLRLWGCIVGSWGSYDVSGLIGEAKDDGDDYAFIMNGFQHAAALAPVVKYDKRYAKATGKWILNLANASRLFYPGFLPEVNQDGISLSWSKEYDKSACIPYESIKEVWEGKNPFAMGDALRGKWAPTNLSLYSGSSVGYLASIIEKTNIEGILQIDLNKTDFRGNNDCQHYLYYNPTSSDQDVQLALPDGSFDIYDAISEILLASKANSSISFNIKKNDAILLRLHPVKAYK